jgi:hypothetical protein
MGHQIGPISRCAYFLKAIDPEDNDEDSVSTIQTRVMLDKNFPARVIFKYPLTKNYDHMTLRMGNAVCEVRENVCGPEMKRVRRHERQHEKTAHEKTPHEKKQLIFIRKGPKKIAQSKDYIEQFKKGFEFLPVVAENTPIARDMLRKGDVSELFDTYVVKNMPNVSPKWYIGLEKQVKMRMAIDAALTLLLLAEAGSAKAIDDYCDHNKSDPNFESRLFEKKGEIVGMYVHDATQLFWDAPLLVLPKFAQFHMLWFAQWTYWCVNFNGMPPVEMPHQYNTLFLQLIYVRFMLIAYNFVTDLTFDQPLTSNTKKLWELTFTEFYKEVVIDTLERVLTKADDKTYTAIRRRLMINAICLNNGFNNDVFAENLETGLQGWKKQDDVTEIFKSLNVILTYISINMQEPNSSVDLYSKYFQPQVNLQTAQETMYMCPAVLERVFGTEVTEDINAKQYPAALIKLSLNYQKMTDANHEKQNQLPRMQFYWLLINWYQTLTAKD